MEDEVRFVQKSVANNMADYFKVNRAVAMELVVSTKNLKMKIRSGY